jgi:hypothetical protein
VDRSRRRQEEAGRGGQIQIETDRSRERKSKTGRGRQRQIERQRQIGAERGRVYPMLPALPWKKTMVGASVGFGCGMYHLGVKGGGEIGEGSTFSTGHV